jgi:hypothetical protein
MMGVPAHKMRVWAVADSRASEAKTAQNQTQSRFFFARKATEILGQTQDLPPSKS